jgi:H+/Cl- antiporter ClcA
MSQTHTYRIKQVLKKPSFQWFLLWIKRGFSIAHVAKWSLFVAVISLLVGTASAILLFSIEWAIAMRTHLVFLFILLPLVGLLTGWMYASYGKGLPQDNRSLRDILQDTRRTVPFRLSLLTWVFTSLSHLSGASVGREGSALYIALSLADKFRRLLRLGSSDRKVLLLAALAAGFGSVFGTPLTGAVFALEVFAQGFYQKARAFFVVLGAAFAADFVASAWGVTHAFFTLPKVELLDVSLWGLLAFSGVVFGLITYFFHYLKNAVAHFLQQRIPYPVLRPFLGGLVLLLLWLPDFQIYAGLGVPQIEASFHTQQQPEVFLLKLLFTALSLAFGFKGGEVTPLFFMGATAGSALSSFLGLPIAVMAGTGLVAVFAAANTTIWAGIVLSFELLGAKGMLMGGFTAWVAVSVVKWLHRRS